MQSFTLNSCKYPMTKKKFNKKYKSEIRQAIFNARQTSIYNNQVTYNALNYIENLILPMRNTQLNYAIDMCYNTNNMINSRSIYGNKAYLNALDSLLDMVNNIEDINLPILNASECFIDEDEIDEQYIN